MDIRRRIYTLIIAAVLILVFLPAAVFADEDVKPVKAEWTGFFELQGVIGSDEIINLETTDVASFTVTYSDDSTRKFIYREIEQKEGEETYTMSGFFAEGEDPEEETSSFYPFVYEEEVPVEFREGWNDIQLELNVPYATGKGTEEESVDYVKLLTDVRVLCAVRKPLKVEFIPAEGFEPYAYIGINYLTIADFFGEGNAFRVTYQDWDAEKQDYAEYTSTALYVNQDGEEGFYPQGRLDRNYFDFDDVTCDLIKGVNNVEFTYREYVETLDEDVEVSFTIPINVQKYDAYADWPIYDYSGKVITPKFKVYDSDDNLVPAKQYTVKAPKAKKLGWYDAEITFKDAYRDSFIQPVFTASYGIGPRRPVLRKVTGGKKSLTVVWKKFTSAQLKKIDYVKIEIAKDKAFSSGYKSYKVKGKVLKSGKKVLKKLTKGKKYYVQLTAYKKITQNGEKFDMPSRESAVKYAKTK